jgi:xanthine dehydrogenase small subunit
LQLDTLSNVKDISILYGGMASTTKRAMKTESFLVGKPWKRTTIEKAMQIVSSEFQPISDARAQATSRTIMARNLLLKFWSETHPQLTQNNNQPEE